MADSFRSSNREPFIGKKSGEPPTDLLEADYKEVLHSEQLPFLGIPARYGRVGRYLIGFVIPGNHETSHFVFEQDVHGDELLFIEIVFLDSYVQLYK